MTVNNNSNTLTAVNHLDSEGSVVRSGIVLAEAVLQTLDRDGKAFVSFAGLRGASSSYFNVFLRRIQEGCGLAEIGDHIVLEFGSPIQEMIYQRSLDAISKRPMIPTITSQKNNGANADSQENRQSKAQQKNFRELLVRLIHRLFAQ